MASDDTPRRGCLTDAQRAELRAIIAAEYRGTINPGASLLLDGFITDLKPTIRAAIEFDFVPDPRAAVEPEPVPFVIPAKPDPVAAFVGLLMANPDDARRLRELVRRLVTCRSLFEVLGYLYEHPSDAAQLVGTLAQLIERSESQP